jgi:hypothetical protein
LVDPSTHPVEARVKATRDPASAPVRQERRSDAKERIMERLVGALVSAATAGLICLAGLATTGGAQAAPAEARAAKAAPAFPLWHRGGYASFALSGDAAQARLSPAFRACIAGAGSEAAKDACIDDEAAVQGAILDAAFRTALARRDNGKARDALRTEQAAWSRGAGGLGEIVRRTVWLELA